MQGVGFFMPCDKRDDSQVSRGRLHSNWAAEQIGEGCRDLVW